MHAGMTSSDVLDTCFNVQLVRRRHPISDVDALLAALKRRAFEHKLTPTVGRSHGIHAEPTTFGLKLAYAYADFPAPASAWRPPERKSRRVPFPAPSAPLRRSIRVSKRMCRPWG